MSDFAKLKASKDTKNSFIKRAQQETQNINLNEAQKQQDKPMLVDSPDTPEILEPPSVICGQPQPTESRLNDAQFSLPPGLELRFVETRGRGIWSQKARRRGEFSPRAVRSFI